MTLSIFIIEAENKGDQNIRRFRKRMVIQRLIKALWTQLFKDKKHYALIANFLDPKIDLVLLSEDGCGVINLMECHGTIVGPVNNLWHDINDRGEIIEVVRPQTSAPNPLEQVREYKGSFQTQLITYNEKKHTLPPWVCQAGNFSVQAAVVFATQRFGLNLLKIDPRDKLWFSLLWLSDIPQWIRTLEFGHEVYRQGLAYRLSASQIDMLANEVLGAHPWIEFDTRYLSYQES